MNDKFMNDVAGTLNVATRMIAALVETHPNPEAVVAAFRAQATSGSAPTNSTFERVLENAIAKAKKEKK